MLKEPATAPTLNIDANVVSVEGTVTVTASATNYTPGTVTVPIISRTASDVEGYRVTMLAGDGAWLGFGAKKVKVEVTRVNNIAYPWTRFGSLVVALRDTTPVTGGPDRWQYLYPDGERFCRGR